MLPPSAGPPTLCEKYAVLAAIYDCFAFFVKSRPKVDPWAWAHKDDSIPPERYARWIVPHASRYDCLKRLVNQCRDSESWPWLKGDEPYKPTDEQNGNKTDLLAWLDEVSEDLQAVADQAPHDPGDKTGGTGTAGGTHEKKAGGSKHSKVGHPKPTTKRLDEDAKLYDALQKGSLMLPELCKEKSLTLEEGTLMYDRERQRRKRRSGVKGK